MIWEAGTVFGPIAPEAENGDRYFMKTGNVKPWPWSLQQDLWGNGI